MSLSTVISAVYYRHTDTNTNPHISCEILNTPIESCQKGHSISGRLRFPQIFFNYWCWWWCCWCCCYWLMAMVTIGWWQCGISTSSDSTDFIWSSEECDKQNGRLLYTFDFDDHILCCCPVTDLIPNQQKFFTQINLANRTFLFFLFVRSSVDPIRICVSESVLVISELGSVASAPST